MKDQCQGCKLFEAVNDEIKPDGELRTMDMSHILTALREVKAGRTEKTNAYENPINEVLFDMTWGYTHWHDKQGSELCGDILDELNGTRGVFEWLFDQATQFQAHWVTLPLEYRESGEYMGDVQNWLSDALVKLAASVYPPYPHVERMKREILVDVRKGKVPVTCVSFAELHDHVDANCYGGFCEEGFDESKTSIVNDAQNAIDLWIKAGGLWLKA